ncbi:MAG: YdcF family protein [Lachnoclostridium sp.]|nr:YdcF family protein [Lachnoclostridium sp.]
MVLKSTCCLVIASVYEVNKFDVKLRTGGVCTADTACSAHHKTADQLQTEADRFAEIAMGAGVPKEDIIIENRATNTKDNILFTKAMFEKRGCR